MTDGHLIGVTMGLNRHHLTFPALLGEGSGGANA